MTRRLRGQGFFIGVSVASLVGAHPLQAKSIASLTGSATTDTPIEFLQPNDWRCTTRGLCTDCHNVTDHQTAIRVSALGASDAETLVVPVGSGLQVCSNAEVVTDTGQPLTCEPE